MLKNISIDTTFKAMSEPRRREILRMLSFGELTAGEIASGFDVTQPAISQHLGVLAEAGLVTVRKAGTRRFYRAVPQRIDEIRAYLADFWLTALDRLKEAAEKEEAEKTEQRRKDGNAN